MPKLLQKHEQQTVTSNDIILIIEYRRNVFNSQNVLYHKTPNTICCKIRDDFMSFKSLCHTWWLHKKMPDMNKLQEEQKIGQTA
jgi:hypothetical protein